MRKHSTVLPNGQGHQTNQESRATQQNAGSTRNSMIDVVKGIGILLVVFGHTQLVLREKGELFRVIFSFHLPLFFVLGGVFLSIRKPFPVFLAGKFRTLLMPYFLVSAGCFLYQMVCGDIHAARQLFRLVWASGQSMPYGWLPVWFLPHLFVVVGFSYFVVRTLVRRATPAWGWGVVIAAFLVLGKLVLVDAQHLEVGSWTIGQTARLSQLPAWPFTMDALLVSTGFMIAGYAAREQILSGSFADVRWFVASLSVFIGLHTAFDYTVDLSQGIYDHAVISSLEAITGTYLAIYLASRLCHMPYFGASLRYFGERSLYVMVFHSIGGILLVRLTGITENGALDHVLVHSSVAVIGGLAMSIAVFEFKTRFLSPLPRPCGDAK